MKTSGTANITSNANNINIAQYSSANVNVITSPQEVLSLMIIWGQTGQWASYGNIWGGVGRRMDAYATSYVLGNFTVSIASANPPGYTRVYANVAGTYRIYQDGNTWEAAVDANTELANYYVNATHSILITKIA